MQKSTAAAALLILSCATAALAVRGRDTVTALPRAGGVAVTVPPSEARGLFEQAERLHAEGSYAAALAIYDRLSGSALPADRARWVDFRRADSLWRSRAAGDDADPTEIDRARQMLEQIVAGTGRVGERDEVWAEAQESLGDFWWTRRGMRNWGAAWPAYEQALDWWAGSGEIERARQRYLNIVWKAARPPAAEPYETYGYYGNQIPEPVLRNALEIARDPEERGRAWYLLALTLRYQSASPGAHRRAAEAFEAAIEAGRGLDEYDDALWSYAEWLGSSGRLVRLPEGGFRAEPDFTTALAVLRRLTSEFGKGQTRYFDEAKRRIEEITGPQVGVSVSNAFLSGSEVRYDLTWRNVERIELALYSIDLTRDVHLGPDQEAGSWLTTVKLAERAAVRSWSYATNDTGGHAPGQATLTLDGTLVPGAYAIEARAAGRTGRDLVLVTGTALVLKTSGTQVVAFLCDAVSGAPHAAGRVSLWTRSHDGRHWNWRESSGTTDASGLARFALDSAESGRELFAAATQDGQQAFSAGYSNGPQRGEETWRLYAFTDRPAYRPDEEVGFKLVARLYDGGTYHTPAGRALDYEVVDPLGAKLKTGRLTLNAFGSAWTSLQLGSTLPLGEYRVTFRDPQRDTAIGGAVLFRIEEYKLPEFKVEVATPQENGRPRALRTGETVEIDVTAEYYFGGPVGHGEVEVLVYQKPLWIRWQRPRDYPWLYPDSDAGRSYLWGGPGQIVHRSTLTTGADGRAHVRFDPPEQSDQDFEYTIEARVTDASRREVQGRGTVRASRQRYFAFLEPSHWLYRPHDEVRIAVRTQDAGERPLAAEGRLRVTRDSWVEIWIDPLGREISGPTLEKARSDGSIFAPPKPGKRGWRLKFRGYEHEEILKHLVRTGEDGAAELSFTPEREGYYRVSYSGDEEQPYPVAAETTVWVGDGRTDHLGYRPGGVQIVADADTFRAGRKAAVLLAAPVPDTWVLFTVEGDELYDVRVVHVSGTVKFVELDVDERYVPGVYLGAAAVREGELSTDSRQVVVPPVEHFLDVEVQADRAEFRPGEQAQLTVTTRDVDGRPVPAEVAVSLVDDSVFYIQQDYAMDPRQFFFGEQRGLLVQTHSSLQAKPYARDLRDAEGRPIDALETDAAGLQDSISPRFKEEKLALASKASGVIGREALAQSRADAAPPAAAEFVQDLPVGTGPAVQVRTDFRATAVWEPALITGADGRATLQVTLPDSLTTWRATARAATEDNRFGIGSSSTRTSKPLIVSLQAPRFFVVGDTATVSAVLHNNTSAELTVAPTIAAAGLTVLGDAHPADVRVPAGGEARVDWPVEARETGTARVQVAARAAAQTDAMERTYDVYEHGIEKLIAQAGKLRAKEQELALALDLPHERRPGSTTLSVQVTPSLAVALLDALPYLIDYPYGCTEQTMSRFLPAVVVARTLERLGLAPRDIAGRMYGGIESAQANATHPAGAKDLERLNEMVHAGLARLGDFQHADGGWGWWKEGESDRFMTAYVAWGLGLAGEADVRLDQPMLERAAEFLDRELVQAEDQPELQVFMLHALATLPADGGRRRPTQLQLQALEHLWVGRDGLSAYGRALLALTAHGFGDAERARVLARNLANGVTRDASNGTAHWGRDASYFRWYDGGVEATAFALRALAVIDPASELIEPAMTWLVRNRRGAQWSNTRDTAIALLTLTDYLKTSGELGSDVQYELSVNGRQVARERVTAARALQAPSRFVVDPSWLRDGRNEIRVIRVEGSGPVYVSAEARLFSLEEPVTAEGHEIYVRREYHRLAGRPTLLKGFVYDRQPLADGAALNSGERAEVVLTVEAKNDYEYLVFEDLKPAGLEAVQVRSGEPLYARELTAGGARRDPASREAGDYTGRTRLVYQELRDRKVACFIDKLPQGTWELRYEVRAETPGKFHALPTLGHAMYVPEIRCNGAELRLEVRER